MIESTEFRCLAHKYNMVGVPRTIINESITVEGAVPEEIFLQNVLKTVQPEEKK